MKSSMSGGFEKFSKKSGKNIDSYNKSKKNKFSDRKSLREHKRLGNGLKQL